MPCPIHILFVVLYERSPQHFCQSILCRQRAHMTLIGLYKGLERLESNIIFRYLTNSQRNACKKLRTVMRCIRQSFYAYYGMEIDDACLLVKSVCNNMKIQPTDYDNETLYAYVTNSLQKQIFPCAVSLTPIEVTRG